MTLNKYIDLFTSELIQNSPKRNKVSEREVSKGSNYRTLLDLEVSRKNFMASLRKNYGWPKSQMPFRSNLVKAFYRSYKPSVESVVLTNTKKEAAAN